VTKVLSRRANVRITSSGRRRIESAAAASRKCSKQLLSGSFLEGLRPGVTGRLVARCASTAVDRTVNVEPRFLGSDKTERAPVEIAIAASDSRDQPVLHHVY